MSVSPPDLSDPTAGGWERLDRRVMVVNGLRSSSSAILLVVVLVAFRSGGGAMLPVVLTLGLAGFAVSFGTEAVRYQRTSYRVTPERVELRSGLLQVRHVSVPRDRIRRVELTAGPLHRLFGLSIVSVGTGEHGRADGDAVDLDAITTPLAESLRAQLLELAPRVTGFETPAAISLPAPQGPAVHTPPPLPTTLSVSAPGDDGTELARLSWRWAPYHLLTFWTLLLPLMAIGALWQMLTTIGIDPIDEQVVEGTAGLLDTQPLWALALMVLGGGAVVGVVGSLGAFTVSWFGYRLTREPGERLQLQRGLFTTRTTTFDERRLRGVKFQQSLAGRIVGAGRLRVIAHGVTGADQPNRASGDALLPPVPAATAHEVATKVLKLDEAPTSVELIRHPAGARERRLIRAAIAAVALVGGAMAAVAADVGPWVLAPALVLAALVFVLAIDSYRSLGHRVHGPHLIARSGSPTRTISALQRSGIIGWTISQTFFQRRRGLCTLTATTAAGDGAYSIIDLSLDAAAQLACQAVPGLLDHIVTADGDHGRADTARGPFVRLTG